jgi:hypothetical protein
VPGFLEYPYPMSFVAIFVPNCEQTDKKSRKEMKQAEVRTKAKVEIKI